MNLYRETITDEVCRNCYNDETGRSICPICRGVGFRVVREEVTVNIEAGVKAYIEKWNELQPYANTRKCFEAGLAAAHTFTRRHQMKAYRTELIQVAAVAVAMIEDHDQGSADLADLGGVLAEVADERERQNEKWGPQHHDIPMWLAILMEEVGEASQAFLHVLEAAALTPQGATDGD